MTIRLFHIPSASKRRGDTLPARLRFVARRGVTLVELMIAMLILTIVCIAWLEIIGIQSARKEARRREAVERLAGMMDAFMYDSILLNNKIIDNKKKIKTGCYYLKRNSLSAQLITNDEVYPMYENDLSSIGYRLRVLQKKDLNYSSEFGDNWKIIQDNYWLVGELYNHYGKQESVGKPFFTLPVCLSF